MTDRKLCYGVNTGKRRNDEGTEVSTQGTVRIDRLADQVDRLAEVRDRIAALKNEERALIAQLRAGLGTAQFGTVEGVDVIRADSRENTSVDREAVKTLLGPEAFGTVLKVTPYVALRVLRPAKVVQA